ncbi:hypothetical protein AB0N24_04940 [Arthrobacter sp. NPDC093128]|uniref:hypothetical protein n=1 Tax=Arthrobacter sp. NPDC093128 TaxID=3154979 RepID=UPI00341B7F7A
MSDGTVVTSALIREGLEKLQAETFAEGGLGFGADEVISTSVIQQGMARRYENVLRDGTWGFCDGFIDFSHELMDAWLLDVRSSLYVPGRGTYKTYRVHLFPNAVGWLEVFDEEILTKGIFGRPEDGNRPANAADVRSELKAFPRTVDNIPQWMWDALRAEGITPPVYNSELKTVDWDNKRLPVTDSGTDFSADPVIIDASKEPGIFSKIGAKLFGS